MKKDRYNFSKKITVLDAIAKHYIESDLYEVEIIYFNKCPEKKKNYKGMAVNIYKYLDGRILGRFDICNYEYICDTEKERKNADYDFFVMTCIGTDTVGEVKPKKLMRNDRGVLVDRKGLNSIEEIISECDMFLNSLKLRRKNKKDENQVKKRSRYYVHCRTTGLGVRWHGTSRRERNRSKKRI